MKKAKKVVALALCAVMLVVGSVAGTMAYLTSQDTVINTFTVGNVAITLDEAPVDANGVATTGDRVNENEYKLMPGHEYDKDPTVHVGATSEDCWLFVQLNNGLIDIIDDVTIEDQMEANGWTLVDDTNNVYAYFEPANANDDVVVFRSFKILDDVDDFTGYGANTPITVKACAVQADGLTRDDALNVATFE